MRTFIIRRLLLLIPVLIGVSLFVFMLTRISGNPAAAYITEKMPLDVQARIEASLHLNEPIYVQYWYWLDGILHGNWGVSKAAQNLDVSTAIAEKFPFTFELAMVSTLIAVVVGVSLGTISAVRRNTVVDHATRVMALAGVCLPVFILAIILKVVFAYQLGWFPLSGAYDPFLYPPFVADMNHYTGFLITDTILNLDLPRFSDAISHIALPAICLAFGSIAILTRIMRSSMLEVMGLDYVKTARSKGLPERVVMRKHARRNALIPTTTVVGLTFGGLLGGAVLTEFVFAWPGMGGWSAAAALSNDWASILGFTLVTAIIYVLANLVVDVMYAFLDPRVQLE